MREPPPTPNEVKALAWMRAHYPDRRLRLKRLLAWLTPKPAARRQYTIDRLHSQITIMRHALRCAEEERRLNAESSDYWFRHAMKYGRHLEGCPTQPCTCGFER
jgi:hypothetical protein